MMLTRDKISVYEIKKVIKCFCLDINASKTALLLDIKRNIINHWHMTSRKATFISVENIEIYLLGAIDAKKEKKRLEESIKRLEQLTEMTEKKLSDKNFVERAPGPIVDKEKKRLEEFGIEKKKLEEQLKKL